MTRTDQITIIKRLAKGWLHSLRRAENSEGITKQVNETIMLTNRYALEDCGLTLNEIIGIQTAADPSQYIDTLFQSSKKDSVDNDRVVIDKHGNFEGSPYSDLFKNNMMERWNELEDKIEKTKLVIHEPTE